MTWVWLSPPWAPHMPPVEVCRPCFLYFVCLLSLVFFQKMRCVDLGQCERHIPLDVSLVREVQEAQSQTAVLGLRGCRGRHIAPMTNAPQCVLHRVLVAIHIDE